MLDSSTRGMIMSGVLSNETAWLEIDLGTVQPIIGVTLQRPIMSANSVVTSYKLEVRDGASDPWTPVGGVRACNWDQINPHAKLTHYFTETESARYVRFTGLSAATTSSGSMNIALLAGVVFGTRTVPSVLPRTTTRHDPDPPGYQTGTSHSRNQISKKGTSVACCSVTAWGLWSATAPRPSPSETKSGPSVRTRSTRYACTRDVYGLVLLCLYLDVCVVFC